jgi:hypothetical protein
MLELALAGALALLTLTAVTWITKRHAAPEDWETVTEILWWTIVGTWGYIAFGSAWEGTWSIPVPWMLGVLVGAPLVAYGVFRFAAATVALGRPPRLRRMAAQPLADLRRAQLVGLVAAVAGAAIAGRSGFGVVLGGLLAGIAAIWASRLARPEAPVTGQASPNRSAEDAARPL